VGRVVFLGTGDPLNEERAQAGLAVPLAGGEAMLIDASSGTIVLRQLRAAGIPLETVRHLFITHRHFDHVGGFAPLLTAMVPIFGASLTVYAPPKTLMTLGELLDLTIPGVESWLRKRLRWKKLSPGEAVRVGDVEITPFEVDHGLECVGLRVEQADSTMVFSADTRPCQSVVEHARGADLLVHEAYETESGAERAHAFGHATAAEAGKVARMSGARCLLLTHLRASRFADPEELAVEAEAAFGLPVEVAGDLDAFDF